MIIDNVASSDFDNERRFLNVKINITIYIQLKKSDCRLQLKKIIKVPTCDKKVTGSCYSNFTSHCED
jgi:hypothetical protein